LIYRSAPHVSRRCDSGDDDDDGVDEVDDAYLIADFLF
jgi:hypothetical protein